MKRQALARAILLLALASTASTTAAGTANADEQPRTAPVERAGLAPSSLADLQALEKTLVHLAAGASPAVVFIGGGSGVFISPEGYILTNNHVIAENVQAHQRADGTGPIELSARLTGGRKVKAQIVGRDPAGDIALLKVQAPGPYPFLELGDSDELRIGQWVVALGNPFMLGSPLLLPESPLPYPSGPGDYNPSVSLGVVSALHRSSDMYPDAIQVDVAVNPGSSGGPLITLEGKLVGINGKIQTRIPLVEVNSGVGYAVPSKQIVRFLDPLKNARGGVVSRGRILGLVVARRGDVESGLKVERVAPGSAGANAGFQTGDRILTIDGHSIWSPRRYEGLLGTYPAGSRLDVEVLRGESKTRLAAVLDPLGKGWLGIIPAAGERGVLVKEMVEGGPAAAEGGLKPEDLILRLEGERVRSVVDLSTELEKYWAGDTVKLLVRRAGREEEVKIRLGAHPNPS